MTKVPVERVGGVQDAGPWPSDVTEIAEGKAYNRPVQLSDGTVQTLNVTVTAVNPILRADGTETDGYTVAYQYDDPTVEVI